MKRRLVVMLVGVVALALVGGPVARAAEPQIVPGGPYLTDTQEVELDSLHDYEELVKRLKQLEHSSQGRLQLEVIGTSNEGRDIFLARVEKPGEEPRP